MSFKVTLLPGDGIGPEVLSCAVRVLEKTAEKCGISISFREALIGGIAYDKTGTPLPQETIDRCKESDAVLLGAVGGKKWDGLPAAQRPEKGLLGIRSALELFANLRPAKIEKALQADSPLRADIVEKGIDFVIVRELCGGLYYGERGRDGGDAFDTMAYSEAEVERVARVAFEIAKGRERKKLTSIDKANVLDCSRLWREVVARVAADYPEVEVSNMLVDNAAMQIVRDPSQFDVVLTENMFGDILSDEAAEITGSIGMLPSASLGAGRMGLYEPIHGSAPDIAGKGIANPLGTILSGALLLRHSLGCEEGAALIERAVSAVLESGLRTADLGGDATTVQMEEAVLAQL